MKKLLFIMALLCVTMAGFAKREKIYLDDCSRSLLPLIEAYIDDRMLEFEILEDLGTTAEGTWKQYNGDEFWVNLPTK